MTEINRKLVSLTGEAVLKK